jgi:hypothetical protein
VTRTPAEPFTEAGLTSCSGSPRRRGHSGSPSGYYSRYHDRPGPAARGSESTVPGLRLQVARAANQPVDDSAWPSHWHCRARACGARWTVPGSLVTDGHVTQ